MASSRPIMLGAAALLTAAQYLVVPGASASDSQEGQAIGEHRASPQVYYKEPPPPHTLGKPFELMDHDGKTVTNASYPGKWLVMFFGFTGCRESCPVGLDAMARPWMRSEPRRTRSSRSSSTCPWRSRTSLA